MEHTYDTNGHKVDEEGKLLPDLACKQCIMELNAKVPQEEPPREKSHQ